MVMKVLIVDDEIGLLQNLASFLSAFPSEFAPATAASAEEALDWLDEHTDTDILLTDIRMPGLDGIELVRRTLLLRPEIGIVVMTAFPTPSARGAALREGAIRFLEKPLDLDSVRQCLLEIGPADHRRSHEVGGLDVCEVAQFVAASGEARVMQFRAGDRIGTMTFDRGDLVHCSTGTLKGPDAFFEMALWGEGAFVEVYGAEAHRFTPNLTTDIRDLLAEADTLVREVSDHDSSRSGNGSSPTGRGERSSARAASSTSGDSKSATSSSKEKSRMAIKDHLEGFQGIEGFMGVAVFTAQGEMLEGFAQGKVDIKTIGMFANNALLNAQKATDQMGVGRGNLMQIRAPQAVVLMRCLNEATDFAATKEGKAHFHTVVVMDPEGNAGMAAMLLDKAAAKIAEEMR